MKRVSADWGWGLLAGTLFGLAVAMIFVEPEFITPDSDARLYVAGIGIVGATLAVVARNWFSGTDRNSSGSDQIDENERQS